MKVLFVRSGNKGLDVISTNQGKSLQKEGIQVFYYEIIGKGILGYLKNIIPLRKYISQTNPDLIHAHYSLCGIVSKLTFTSKKTIVSLMGSDVYTVTPFYRLIICIFSKLFWSKVIFKSEEMQQKIKIKNSIVIPNGVDFDIFKPQDINVMRKKLNLTQQNIILFASEPHRKEKNFPFAEKVLQEVQHKFPNTQFIFLHNKTSEEVAQYLNAVDLMLLTSTYEGSPNIVKEALACNCPVVSSNVGDVKKNVGKSSHNFVIDTFDEAQFAKAIVTILQNKERSNGRNFIPELDSINIAKKLILLYKQVTEKPL